MEDLTSVWEEVAGERAEDSMIIEELEMVEEWSLVIEVEEGTDENRFEVWMICHHAMVKEIDNVNCNPEKMDQEICLVMDQ